MTCPAHPSPPYGEVQVHVVEVERAATPRDMARAIDGAIRMVEAARRIIQGSVSVQPGPVYCGPDGTSLETVWLFFTTRPGPCYPATSHGAAGDDAPGASPHPQEADRC